MVYYKIKRLRGRKTARGRPGGGREEERGRGRGRGGKQKREEERGGGSFPLRIGFCVRA